MRFAHLRPLPAAASLAALLVSTAVACATGSATTDDPEADAAVSPEAGPDGATSSDTGAPVPDGGSAAGPRAPTVGEVIFSEMMINPDGVSDEFGEWVELYNTTATPLSLRGCRLSDESAPKDDKTIDVDVVVPAKSAVVLARSTDPSKNGGIVGAVFEYGASFVLANGGDTTILSCGGAEVDRVVFASTWPFGKGATMQLRTSALGATANDAASGWCLATLGFGSGSQRGTPGNTQNHCP